MQKVLRSLVVLAVAGAFAVFTPSASAAAKKVPTDKPVTGKISAIDKEAKAITVGDKVIAVDETSIITTSGKPAKFEDLKTGQEASVSVFRLGEKLTATNVKVGTVAAAATALPKKKK